MNFDGKMCIKTDGETMTKNNQPKRKRIIIKDERLLFRDKDDLKCYKCGSHNISGKTPLRSMENTIVKHIKKKLKPIEK